MQSNSKVIQSLISKIQSPLTQIRNRAITTLYTKVSAKIITDNDLIKSHQLPGVLFTWVNETTPTNKDCLYKTLSILHRYTFSQQGLRLLSEYEAMQFLQEFRKFLMANESNVDQHVDLIKKVIKALLPLDNYKVREQKNDEHDQQEQQQQQSLNGLRQQQQDYENDGQQQYQQQPNKRSKTNHNNKSNTNNNDNNNKKSSHHHQNTKVDKNKAIKNTKHRHIIQFQCLNQYLPKQIDQQLYSLLIQLKHGKKQSILQTLIKMEEIILYWGYRYFGYKEELIKEMVVVIEGKVYSEVACRVLGLLIRQCLEMEEDIGGCNKDDSESNSDRNYLRTITIGQNNHQKQPKFLTIQFEISFDIFTTNPFTITIFQTLITHNRSLSLSQSSIQYLLIAVTKYPYSSAFLLKLLQKIYNNKKWLHQQLTKNKFYQQQLILMINHCCGIQQQNTCSQQLIQVIEKLFPNNKSVQQISRRIPNLKMKMQQQQMQQSFKVLTKYSQQQQQAKNSKNFFKPEQKFDFNLQLHQLQSHINNLEAGINGLPKNPSIISLYVDCLLMLAVSVAKQDPLMSYYPKIKSIIIKISQHEYLTCRVTLYETLLMAFNSSEKINYLAQSFLKSQLIRLVFTDGEFFSLLFKKALCDKQTINVYLEVIKIMQTTMKEENRKYLNKYAPVFYMMSFQPSSSTISSASKIILSRTPKKYQITNILLSIFCKLKQQRQKTFVEILGLPQSQDLLQMCLHYTTSNPQKKSLKYSLSTIRNYMSIILNPKLQMSIKSSAIQQMIECSHRIDIGLIQKDDQFLKQILSIRNSLEQFIKAFINNQQNGQSLLQRNFFVQMVMIFSILQKRLRLQCTTHLNQSSIKFVSSALPAEMLLNVLINLCTIWQQQGQQKSLYKQAISLFMMVVYYHVMTTYTSKLLLQSQQSYGQKDQKSKKNTLTVHWIVKMFPHQQIISQQVQQILSVANRNDFVNNNKSKKTNFHNSSGDKQKQRQNLINDFLKTYKVNIKSMKQLMTIYVQNYCTQTITNNNQKTFYETLKMKSTIICPILQRQLSTAIHNLNNSHSEISFLAFFIESIGQMINNSSSSSSLSSLTCRINIFQPLQEIIPHIINQLQKPNIPLHINLLLIRICNVIGWKRTKTIDSLVQQFNVDELYLLKLVNKLPKLSSEELSRIIKTTLSSSQLQTNLKLSPSLILLWQILLKPANLKTLISSPSITEYTQLLVFNSLIKCIVQQQQTTSNDNKLTNYSIILMHQLLSEILFQVKKVAIIQESNNIGFDNDNKDFNKTLEIVKLVGSLSISTVLMKYLLEQLQQSKQSFNPTQSNSLNLQSVCFLLQVLKTSFSIQNFIIQQGLNQSNAINLNHQTKIIKLFVISLNQYVRSHPQLMNYSSTAMFFSSILDFINSLFKNSTYCQCANAIDLLDFAITMFYQKGKKLSIKNQLKNVNKRESQSYLLFSSILEYAYLRLQQNPKQNAHYLLSSTSFLQASFHVMLYLKNNIQNIEKQAKTKIYIKQLLQKLGKVLHSISLNQEDYFIFKLNHVCQQFSVSNLLETFACLNQYGHQNFLIFFMRLVLIWQGKTQGQKVNQQKKTQFQALNPGDIFEDEEQDDSSIEERQLFSKDQKPKNPFENNWIFKLIDLAVQRGHIKYCKSLIALSLPAKMFLIQKPGFAQHVKKITSLIDSKIIYESNTTKKKLPKKSSNMGNASVLLSNSRKSVVSQNLSSITFQDQLKNSPEDEKLKQIEDFIKFLTSLFAVHETLASLQKQQFYVSFFITHLNRYKDVSRKLFYSVDKLYTLSQLLNSGANQNKQFGKCFLKMINALSESVIFSQSLSNHLTEVTSPMLEQSISTMLKGMSQANNQQDAQKIKQSLKIMSTLSNHESVRSYIYKSKLIEEFNSRIIKYEQKKTDKSDFLNLNSLYDIVGFYSSLSKYKDSHNKILNDKKVLEVLINQVYMQKSDLISQKILELLSNLSAYKLNKAVFMQNRQIHKTILGQLQSSQIDYKCHLLTLLYNLMYRHAPAVKLYKRKDIIEMIQTIPWQKFDNWENVKHIQVAILDFLRNQSQIPDKNN